MNNTVMTKMPFAVAIAIALCSPAIAQTQGPGCPASERERAGPLAELRAIYQDNARELVAARKKYWSWSLEAQGAFDQRMSALRDHQTRALGSPMVTIGEFSSPLDQIAIVTRLGGSAKVMLTPEGRQAVGIDTPEREIRALEEIARSLRSAFASHGARARVLESPHSASWVPTQWGGSILALSFDRFPGESAPPLASLEISERYGPRGRALWATLEAAEARVQASDSAFRACSGAPATRWDSLTLPAALPPQHLLSQFSNLETREFRDSIGEP